MSKLTPHAIQKKASQLGYLACGIINVERMQGYEELVRRRLQLFPGSGFVYNALLDYHQPRKIHPWANSIVVCVRRYGKYKMPPHLDGLVGRYYAMETRRDLEVFDYAASFAFEEFMNQGGLKTLTNRKYALTGMRWAASQAGLGVLRKNNFFYSQHGSWVYLEAWLIDAVMELIQTPTLKPCPEKCDLCVRACPTQALSAAHTMNPQACIAPLTYWTDLDLTTNPYSHKMGAWVYGCDLCQLACPFNKNAWSDEGGEFPGLAKAAQHMYLEKLLSSDYDTLLKDVQPKFWYIGKKDMWQWKVNALNAMRNTYQPSYKPYIEAACNDEYAQVRDMARWVLERL